MGKLYGPSQIQNKRWKTMISCQMSANKNSYKSKSRSKSSIVMELLILFIIGLVGSLIFTIK